MPFNISPSFCNCIEIVSMASLFCLLKKIVQVLYVSKDDMALRKCLLLGLLVRAGQGSPILWQCLHWLCFLDFHYVLRPGLGVLESKKRMWCSLVAKKYSSAWAVGDNSTRLFLLTEISFEAIIIILWF